MKQNKLLILSLLASFLLLTMASYSYAANTVTFGPMDVCPQPAGSKVYVPVYVDNDVDLFGFDIIGQVVSISGGVDLVVTGVEFVDRMDSEEVLDQRYPIGDLGGGIFRLGAVQLMHSELAVGSGQIATLELSFVSECLLGSAALDPGSFMGDETVFVDPSGALYTPDPITSGAVNVVNSAPYFTNCPDTDFEIYWKNGAWGTNSVIIPFEAMDVDLDCGCDVLTFSVEGPGDINTSTGMYQFVAGVEDIGCHDVTVTVSDEYGGEDVCEFSITVLNNPPEFVDCPPSDVIYVYTWGQTVTQQLTADDPDGGPNKVFSLESFDGPGSPTVDASTGLFTWETLEDPAYIGVFHATIKVTDNAPSTPECPIENSDMCTLTFKLDPKFRVLIEKEEGPEGRGAYLGHYTTVSIDFDDSYTSVEMGGFDFLIGYDQSALSFVEAEPGDLLVDGGWEYFTYRHGYDGNCGNGCPSGMLRLVALAETNNGPYHPTNFDNSVSSNLANLTFYVVNDHNLDCMYAPIYWFWMDCGDNAISSKYGDTLFLEDRVFTFEDFEDIALGDPSVYEVTDHPATKMDFPSYYGTADECLDTDEFDKAFPIRFIDFRNGGIDIICDSLIDDRGDVNMNGIAYEIADAVMLTNYFVNGLTAFNDHIDGSIAASDANADGATLTVADLVYMIRVIQGDALPYPKPDPNALFTVVTQQIGSNMTVGVESTHEAGAALFIFNVTGDVGQPILADGVNMDVLTASDNGEFRVLVYNIGDQKINSGDLMTIPVNGSIELTEVEAADYNGTTMTATTRVLPSTFDLAQNYPNPFNPTTTISIALPVASDFTLDIYNIAGQKIRTFTGSESAGVVEVVWDGTDTSGSTVASGIYFYKVKAGDFSSTKQMVLLK
jgi:hypothetical protein